MNLKVIMVGLSADIQNMHIFNSIIQQNNMDKRELRSSIFRHLDGIVTAPVVAALQNRRILHLIYETNTITLQQLTAKSVGHEGYANVALRVMALHGFLEYQLNVQDASV